MTASMPHSNPNSSRQKISPGRKSTSWTVLDCKLAVQSKAAKHTMNASDEATLEMSFPKALLFSALSMACFLVGCYFIGIPMHDYLFIGFLVVMVFVMTPVFAVCFVFMLSCRISRDGLRPAAPTLYQRVLRWEEIVSVRRSIGSPFYVARGPGIFGSFCVLPSRFLLKHPDKLRELLDRYAPADNIVRKTLAA